MTEKLYDFDSYLTEFDAEVLNCARIDDKYIIELDKTAFFPEEGGQCSDQGFINENYIEYVKGISPKTNQKRTLFHAFWVGGTICAIGQSFRYLLQF